MYNRPYTVVVLGETRPYKAISHSCHCVSLYTSILARIRLTYKTGFGLDDWIYCTLYSYIRGTRDYSQYSAITDLHTFQFTVTHALELFLLLVLLNHSRLPSPEFDKISSTTTLYSALRPYSVVSAVPTTQKTRRSLLTRRVYSAVT
jgi:hypothetical protein